MRKANQSFLCFRGVLTHIRHRRFYKKYISTRLKPKQKHLFCDNYTSISIQHMYEPLQYTDRGQGKILSMTRPERKALNVANLINANQPAPLTSSTKVNPPSETPVTRKNNILACSVSSGIDLKCFVQMNVLKCSVDLVPNP